MLKALGMALAGLATLFPFTESASTQQKSGKGPRIEIRQARETPAPGFSYRPFAYPSRFTAEQKAGLYIADRPLLTDDDFQSVTTNYPAPGGLTLTLFLTHDAAGRMLQETRDKMGSFLATLLDSRLVAAARLASPVGPESDIPIFMGLQVPDEIAKETAARVAARWP